ncbi:hypothetical protein MKSMC1_11880 [Mycobacterium kansasii]|nr:hypothetical protein MKSMC1_11880 [Mycobacterium kansasii]
MIAIGLSVPPADLVKLSSIARLELFDAVSYGVWKAVRTV